MRRLIHQRTVFGNNILIIRVGVIIKSCSSLLEYHISIGSGIHRIGHRCWIYSILKLQESHIWLVRASGCYKILKDCRSLLCSIKMIPYPNFYKHIVRVKKGLGRSGARIVCIPQGECIFRYSGAPKYQYCLWCIKRVLKQNGTCKKHKQTFSRLSF